MSESATRQLSSGERTVLRALAKEHASNAEAAAIMVARLEAYLEDLLSWTRDSNLVAQNDLGRLASRHVTESLAVLPLLDRLAPKRLIDLGSGAGFPAIPLQIARPEMAVTVVESRRRKGLFLQRTIDRLELENARAIMGRAEQLEKEDGLSVEVLDLRSLAPLDDEAIQATVRKTNRALVVHEDTRTGGLAGEIAARINESSFAWLEDWAISCRSVPSIP